jgi:hypothetical protein
MWDSSLVSQKPIRKGKNGPWILNPNTPLRRCLDPQTPQNGYWASKNQSFADPLRIRLGPGSDWLGVSFLSFRTLTCVMFYTIMTYFKTRNMHLLVPQVKVTKWNTIEEPDQEISCAGQIFCSSWLKFTNQAETTNTFIQTYYTTYYIRRNNKKAASTSKATL